VKRKTLHYGGVFLSKRHMSFMLRVLQEVQGLQNLLSVLQEILLPALTLLLLALLPFQFPCTQK
jgi:hypothetical protein